MLHLDVREEIRVMCPMNKEWEENSLKGGVLHGSPLLVRRVTVKSQERMDLSRNVFRFGTTSASVRRSPVGTPFASQPTQPNPNDLGEPWARCGIPHKSAVCVQNTQSLDTSFRD